MVSLIECRANEIVHCRIRDNKVLFTVLFGIKHAGQQSSGLSDEEASGLEEQMHVQAPKGMADCSGILGDASRRIEGGRSILDPKPTSSIDVANIESIGAQLLNEHADTLQRLGEWFDGSDLGTDVNAHASRIYAGKLCGAMVDLSCALDGNAELVLTQPSGDVRMRLGEDVRVDTERNLRHLAPCRCPCGEHVQFGFAFDIEEQNVRIQGRFDLPNLLSDAGEDHVAESGGGGAANALKLAPGDDVEPTAEIAEQLENSQRGVGFDRVAEGIRNHRELRLQH